MTYTYDANGNLLNDGVNTYTYDSANRLISITGPAGTVSYRYNGLGDRLQETVNGVTTTFVMDLNSGLTQALSDGTHDYIYGNGRIAQVNGTNTEYFLSDALGSVRQLTDSTGTVTFAQGYDPYGVVTTTAGRSASSYGFTNEYQNSYIKLIYLRSRMYSPSLGRFLTRDTWQGDANSPMSFNGWAYTEDNPINLVDPTGLSPFCNNGEERVNFNGFSYTRCYRIGGGVGFTKNLLVNFRSAPWSKYISNQAPSTTMIPVRHPLDLDKEFRGCYDIEKMRQIFTSGAFYDWELNARNIISEIHGVISAGKEYALRDAIGIAYSPYNRLEYNKNVPEYKKYDPYRYKGMNADPYSDFKGLLLSGRAYAISAGKWTAWRGDSMDKNDRENIYEISLIVAYGVAKRYFVDTSFGAIEYRHRREPQYIGGMVCGNSGQAFFYKNPNTVGVERFGFSSEELWTQQGWDNRPADLLPIGCRK